MSTPRSTARNSATVAVCTLFSRVTGLLRVVVIGAVLGPTYLANSFQASYSVPNIVFTLIAGPVLAMVLVPAVVRALGAGALPGARDVLARVTGWLLLMSAVVVVLVMIAAPLVAWTLTLGIADPVTRARSQWLTTVLVLFVAPQIVLYCLADLGMAAQRALGRFALASAAPAVENLVQIGTVVLAGWYFGAGLDVDRAPLSMIVVLGVGCTAGVALHAGVQLFGAARVGLLVRPSRGWRDDPEAAAVTRRLARSVGVAASPAAAMYVLLAIAGSVPGGVFVVQLSYAVLFALSYVSARAVSMAALPGLARAAHAGDTVKFGSAWREGAYYALLSGTPLLVMLAVLAGPTADLLANGELRGSAVIGPLAACLAIVAVAQLISGISDLGSQALYARLDDRVPRQAALAAFGVKLAVAALSLTVPAGGARLVWLVAAIFAGELASAALVLVRLRRVMRPERFLEPRALGSVLLAGLAMVPVAVAVRWVQRSYGGGHLTDLGILCAGGLVALAAYILVVRATAAGPIVRRS